jgi:hypothetical protein
MLEDFEHRPGGGGTSELRVQQRAYCGVPRQVSQSVVPRTEATRIEYNKHCAKYVDAHGNTDKIFGNSLKDSIEWPL